jgi:hypothetical protein
MFRPANTILWIAACLLIACSMLFVLCALLLHSFNLAWDIASGTSSPFGHNCWLAVVLSAVGYLIVPVLIGLAVTEGLTRFVERRLRPAAEVEAGIVRDLNRNSPTPPAKNKPNHQTTG